MQSNVRYEDILRKWSELGTVSNGNVFLVCGLSCKQQKQKVVILILKDRTLSTQNCGAGKEQVGKM